MVQGTKERQANKDKPTNTIEGEETTVDDGRNPCVFVVVLAFVDHNWEPLH